MFGLNGPGDARLDPQFYALMGARWIRVVLLPDVDLTPWITEAHRRGLKVLGVIARESLGGERWEAGVRLLGERYASLLDAVQAGNEPDHESPSSWTMTAASLNELLLYVNTWFTGVPIVGPGLVSGQPSYLDMVNLDLVDAIACHPYGRRPDNVQDWSETPGNFGSVAELLDAYRYHGKPIWVTEVGVSTDQVSRDFQARYCEAMLKALKLRTDVPTVCWFAADDAMVPEFGLYDANGLPKPAAAAYMKVAGPIVQPEGPIMALPIPVFERMWKAHLPDAEFHPTFGIEKFWMEHYKELGAVTDLAEYREGKNAYRTFVGGVIHWHDDTGARIA